MITINSFSPSKPHAKQKEVLHALDQGERFVLIRAGRKWRKTSLMISWLVEKALETNLTCPFIAPNRVQAKNIVWHDHIQRLITELNLKKIRFKPNETELSITLPRGKIQLFGVENKDALRGVSNWGAVCCDEYDDWQDDIWKEVIRPNLIPHKAPAIVGGTPDGFRNLWKLEHGNIFKSFHFTSHDNPDLDPSELKSLEDEYKEMGMGTYRQEILAEYEKPEGTVYEEWNMDKLYIPFAYDEDLPIHVSWDFGVNDPTAIGVYQPYKKEVRLIDYYEASDADLRHFTDWLDALPYKKPELETGDIAGRARSLITGKSVIAEARRLGHPIRTMPIPDIPSQIRHTHRSIPYLYVNKANPNTARFVECILNYKYPKKSQTLVNQSNELPIHDEFSHGMRQLEYYRWNVTHGEVGMVKEDQRGQKDTDFFASINDEGKQIAINLTHFRK